MSAIRTWLALGTWALASCADELPVRELCRGEQDGVWIECNDGDHAGTLDVRVRTVVHEPARCPVVTGISAHPLSVFVGHELELEAFASSAGGRIRWRAKGAGSFSDSGEAVTRFRCQGAPGPRTLEVELRKMGCPDSAATVQVECERAP